MSRPVRYACLWLASLGIVLAQGCGLISAPTLESGRLAYAKGDWAAAAKVAESLLKVSPNAPEPLQLQARSLARLGRNQESLSKFADLSGGQLQAEDLVLIGRGLAATPRPLLGRLAIEAAVKIDPKNREAATEAAHAPPPGADRIARFSGIASAEALAVLVQGLAASDSNQAEPGPIFSALLRRDRETLSKLSTSDASRKLLARANLEEGNPARARIILAQIQDKSDPETNWILSRVALVEGKSKEALAALERSGNFSASHPVEFEPGRYAGAASCSDCHAEIYESQQTSLHASTVSKGSALAKVPLPRSAVIDPEDPSISHTFQREGDQIRLTTKVKDQTVSALIDYAMGSGHLGMTMLARDPSNKGHRSLRLSYYKGGDHWGLTTGFDPHPKSAESYVGELLSEEGFVRCINCHSTRFLSESGPKGPETADKGIGCERCHGPGENHIKALELSFPEPAIARPKIASPSQRFGLCVQCHGADGVIPPSDPRFVRFQGAILPYSRCYTESGKKLDCVSCHSPHHNLETKPETYEARCLACHSGKLLEKADAQALRLESVKASVCKVNPKTGCVGCHMPKVENAMPFTKFTDHHIRIHRPKTAEPKTAGSP